MSAKIIAFPRRKEMDWSELPDYWGVTDKAYYSYAMEDGMSHEEAFKKQDLCARAPNPIMCCRRNTESYEEYIGRLEAIALSPEEARAARRREG